MKCKKNACLFFLILLKYNKMWTIPSLFFIWYLCSTNLSIIKKIFFFHRFSKGFRGLALTGWQRYDHFAILCELLPSSIPSLLTSLSTVSKGYFEPNPKENDILKVLECPFQLDNRWAFNLKLKLKTKSTLFLLRHSSSVWLDLTPSIHHCQLFFTCAYPGGNVYKYVHSLFEKITEINNYLVHVKDQSAWMSDYNVRHNFTSTLRVRDLTANNERFIYELTAMGRKAYVVMKDIFDEVLYFLVWSQNLILNSFQHTISELVEQKVYPLVLKLKTHSDEGQYLLQRNVWPQRPLPYTRDFSDFIEDIKKVNWIESHQSHSIDDEERRRKKERSAIAIYLLV